MSGSGEHRIPRGALLWVRGLVPLGMADGGDDWDDGGWEREGDSSVATEKQQKLKKPQLYKVLLHNDDYTTMEFVVMVLMDIFHHDEPNAVQIMLHVHKSGIGVAGLFSFEIAETKVRKVTELAKKYEFPLRCTMEPA